MFFWLLLCPLMCHFQSFILKAIKPRIYCLIPHRFVTVRIISCSHFMFPLPSPSLYQPTTLSLLMRFLLCRNTNDCRTTLCLLIWFIIRINLDEEGGLKVHGSCKDHSPPNHMRKICLAPCSDSANCLSCLWNLNFVLL